jgi:hypothetical protein
VHQLVDALLYVVAEVEPRVVVAVGLGKRVRWLVVVNCGVQAFDVLVLRTVDGNGVKQCTHVPMDDDTATPFFDHSGHRLLHVEEESSLYPHAAYNFVTGAADRVHGP